MTLIKILTPDFSFKDDRGSLVQLIHNGFAQFNVITSVKGAYRGGHYHKINSEAFYIINGKLSLELWDLENSQIKEYYNFTSGDMFEIMPNIIHSFKFEEDTTLVSMYSIGVELNNGNKDILIV